VCQCLTPVLKITPEREKRGVRVTVRRIPTMPRTRKSKGQMERGGGGGAPTMEECIVAASATGVGEEESRAEAESVSGWIGAKT
jgi:hypothetical protein